MYSLVRTELQHPRPVRVVEMRNAIQKLNKYAGLLGEFTEISQVTPGSSSRISVVKPRPVNTVALFEESTLPLSRKIVGAERTRPTDIVPAKPQGWTPWGDPTIPCLALLTKESPLPPSPPSPLERAEGRACLSPSFLDLSPTCPSPSELPHLSTVFPYFFDPKSKKPNRMVSFAPPASALPPPPFFPLSTPSPDKDFDDIYETTSEGSDISYSPPLLEGMEQLSPLGSCGRSGGSSTCGNDADIESDDDSGYASSFTSSYAGATNLPTDHKYWRQGMSSESIAFLLEWERVVQK